MGFSKDTFDQYGKEIKIMWRVLAVGAVVAGSVHFFSLPWVSRMISGPVEDVIEIDATPIEVVIEDALVQQTPDPEPEPPEENPAPAASADRPSAPPLATSAEPLPLSEVASADTVAVAPSIATAGGVAGGQGAVGDSSVIGLVPGSGQPTEQGNRINLPDIAALIEPEVRSPVRAREPVQAMSLATRRPPTSRQVSCNPCSLPEYPTTARRENIEGQPVINAIFDENGRVIDAKIEVSSGNAAFDRAAVEEARRNWRFQDPLGLGGQVSVDVVYVIDDSEQYEEAQQAGEIRTVELPVGQQIRSIPPDQSAPSAASQPTTAQGTDANASADTGAVDSSEARETEAGPANTPPAPPEVVHPETAPTESSPAPAPTAPTPQPAPPAPAQAAPPAPVTPPDIFPQAASEPTSPPAVSLAPVSPTPPAPSAPASASE